MWIINPNKIDSVIFLAKPGSAGPQAVSANSQGASTVTVQAGSSSQTGSTASQEVSTNSQGASTVPPRQLIPVILLVLPRQAVRL